jgi:hypothetical protein
MAALQSHDWRRGNIRELRNVLERALTNNPNQDITLEDLGLEGERADATPLGRSVESADAVAAFLALRPRAVGSLRVQELSRVRVEAAGFLPALVAEAVAWALQVTSAGDKANHTAAVRLLLGRDDVTGMEAKRFLSKVLSLDARGGSVWRRFSDLPARPDSALLESILEVLARRFEQQSPAAAKQGGRKRG